MVVLKWQIVNTLIILSIRNSLICVNYLLRHYMVFRRYCWNGKYFVNTEENYLKSSLISVYTLCHPKGNLLHTYPAHLTLLEKNSVKQIRLFLQEWSDLCYSISSGKISFIKGNVKVANSDNTDQIFWSGLSICHIITIFKLYIGQRMK